MIIDAYSVFRFRLPLQQPVRIRPQLTIHERNGVLIRVQSLEGFVGWGEASPLPGFSAESVDDVIRGAGPVLSRLLDRDISTPKIDALFEDHEQILLSPALEFAIESALDAALLGQQNDDGVADNGSRTVSVARLLQGSSAEVVEAAKSAASAGYKCLKLKVGRGDILREAEMVMMVRAAVGPHVAIRLDANMAWTLTEAIRFCNRITPAAIEFLEEPVRQASLIPELAKETEIPIAIDENLTCQSSLIEDGVVAAAVLKPTVLGGVAVRRLIERCHAQGVSPVLSCGYESAVGTFAVARIAAIQSSAAAVGLGTHAYLAKDVTRGRVSFNTPSVDTKSLFGDIMKIDLTMLYEV